MESIYIDDERRFNDVSVIDVGALKVIKSIRIGSFPWGIAISKQ